MDFYVCNKHMNLNLNYSYTKCFAIIKLYVFSYYVHVCPLPDEGISLFV